jgi:hypothetical protein
VGAGEPRRAGASPPWSACSRGAGRGEGAVRDRRGAGPDQSRRRRNTDAAPSPTPGLRRLHRRPAVSTVAFSLFSLRRSRFLFCLCACLRAAVTERVAPPPPHGRRRVALCQREPGVVATPSRVVPVPPPKLGQGKLLQEGLGNTPRRAVVHRAERASRRQPGEQVRLSAALRLEASRRGGLRCAAVTRPSCRGFSVAGEGVRGRRPAAPMRAMAVAPPPGELRVQAFHAAIHAVLRRP